MPGQEPAWTDMAVLLGQIHRLDKELPATQPPEEHVH